MGKYNKLNPKYYGPFQVVDKVGTVAYRLALPTAAMVHPVFHVSQLKKFHSSKAVMGTFLRCDEDGLLAVTPYKVLERKMVKRGNKAAVFGLIQWNNGSVEDITWEDLSDIEKRFPEFSLDP